MNANVNIFPGDIPRLKVVPVAANETLMNRRSSEGELTKGCLKWILLEKKFSFRRIIGSFSFFLLSPFCGEPFRCRWWFERRFCFAMVGIIWYACHVEPT